MQDIWNELILYASSSFYSSVSVSAKESILLKFLYMSMGKLKQNPTEWKYTNMKKQWVFRGLFYFLAMLNVSVFKCKEIKL